MKPVPTHDLSGRTAMLAEATALLDNTAARDARTLNLTQPKRLATGLVTLRELRNTIAAKDLKPPLPKLRLSLPSSRNYKAP